jgi:DNA-binding NarL/FixJ family response regulator
MGPDRSLLIAIAAKPGIMRNSLLSYLRSIPDVRDVLIADDRATLLKLIGESAPGLAIVDSDLSETEMLNVIEAITTNFANTKIIVLVESFRQRQRALAVGATDALLKGFLDNQLRQAILREKEGNHIG